MSTVPEIKFDSYYLYDEITDFLKAAEAVAPDLVTLDSLTTTPEGRQVWIATITDPSTGPAESKPAYHVQANVHAQEMATTTSALRLIHTLLTDENAAELLKHVVFYVIPRANPDGVEYTMTTCGDIRSRNETIEDKPNGLVPQDLNGDGLILRMRWEDPLGPYIEDPEDPRIMVPRRPGDEGPFYQVHAEGIISNYDGGPIQGATKGYDFNRNYPTNWKIEIDQADRPFSHPETSAIGEFLQNHHNIFAGIDFHCGAQAILRPCSKPDAEMDQADLGLVTMIGRKAAEFTGFPMMNSRDYRLDWATPISLPGSSNDFAHLQLGISWYVIELGNGYTSAGISTEEYFKSNDEQREREFPRRVMKAADASPTRDVFVPWQEIDHPQLGTVEVGGLKPAAIYHLDPRDMEKISADTTGFLLWHAARHPRILLSEPELSRVGEGVYRIRANVGNGGCLGTRVMNGGGLRTHEPVKARLEGICEDAIASRPRVYEFDALAPGAHQQLEWFITADVGTQVTLIASHPRGGVATEALELG